MDYNKFLSAIAGVLIILGACAIAPAAYGAERDSEQGAKKVALNKDRTDQDKKDKDAARDERGGAPHVEWNGPSKSVTLSNLGKQPLHLIDIKFRGRDARDFGQSNDCGETLDGKKSCTIKVVFHPTSTGVKSATMEVLTSGGSEVVHLSGTGV